jgi:hypothetical protein
MFNNFCKVNLNEIFISISFIDFSYLSILTK